MYGYILDMDTKSTSTSLKKKLRRKLVALGKKQPFIIGSLVKVQRRCGNPNCRCVRKDQRHIAHLLTTKVKGKTHAIYVPVDMVAEVRQWCRRYRDVKTNIKEISECCEQIIMIHVKEKQAASE